MSKDIIFECPSCKKRLRAESADAGKKAFCPFCQGDVMVPFLMLNDDERDAAFKALEAAFAERPAADRERRTFVRFATEGVRVKMSRGSGCRAVNLSRGGMALACRRDKTHPLPDMGSRVDVTLITPYGKDIRVRGQVVWCRKGGLQPAGGSSVGGAEPSSSHDEILLGVEFSGIEENDVEALRKLERMLVDGTSGGRERREKRQEQ